MATRQTQRLVAGVMLAGPHFIGLCRQVNTNSRPPGIGSDRHRLVQEHHRVRSRRAIAYPNRATTLPQVPSLHDAGPDRTWPCWLHSADIRMSDVRARAAG